MTSPIRYSAACCQTDLPNPLGRLEMRRRTGCLVAGSQAEGLGMTTAQ